MAVSDDLRMMPTQVSSVIRTMGSKAKRLSLNKKVDSYKHPIFRNSDQDPGRLLVIAMVHLMALTIDILK